MIGVNAAPSDPIGPLFGDMTGVTFPLYNDIDYSYQKLFHPTSISPFPFYVLVGPDGVIEAVSHTLNLAEMTVSIQDLLSASPTPEESLCPVQDDMEAISCEPDCQDKICGEDGCGGFCGLCPNAYQCEDGWCQARKYTPEMPQSFFDCYIQCGPDQDCALACTEGHSPEETDLANQLMKCKWQNKN